MKEHILFSKRCKIERMAIEWCVKNNVPTNSFNIVTALCSLGLIESEAAVLTNAMHSDGEGQCCDSPDAVKCMQCQDIGP